MRRSRQGPTGIGDVIEGAEAIELAIAAHPGRAPVIASGLKEEAVDGELDVLQPGQQVVAVVDVDQRLHAADRGVREVPRGKRGRVWPQAAVGVDDGDDRLLAIADTR